MLQTWRCTEQKLWEPWSHRCPNQDGLVNQCGWKSCGVILYIMAEYSMRIYYTDRCQHSRSWTCIDSWVNDLKKATARPWNWEVEHPKSTCNEGGSLEFALGRCLRQIEWGQQSDSSYHKMTCGAGCYRGMRGFDRSKTGMVYKQQKLLVKIIETTRDDSPTFWKSENFMKVLNKSPAKYCKSIQPSSSTGRAWHWYRGPWRCCLALEVFRVGKTRFRGL